MHHRARDRQALHHPAGEAEDELVGAVRELKTLEKALRAARALRGRDPEVRAVEEEDLARGQREVEVRPLRHDADPPLDGDSADPDLLLADPGAARRRPDARRQHADRRRLAGAVRAEQAEDLAGPDLERQVVERHDLDLLLSVGSRAAREGNAHEAPARRRGRRRRGIDLPQLLRPDPDGHRWREVYFGSGVDRMAAAAASPFRTTSPTETPPR